jgi:glycosyltransferase involved in cell wall biosynthesis
VAANGRSKPRRGRRILLIIENVPLARDHRARKQVAGLREAGYDVTVVCRKDAANRRYRDSNSIRLYEYPAPREFGGKLSYLFEYGYSIVASLVLTIWSFFRDGFAVIQAGDPPDIHFVLAAPFKLLGKRFVIDQRDLSPEVYRERYGAARGTIPRILRVLERWSWRAADAVICVNDSLRDAIVDRGTIDPARVVIVGNGPDLASVTPRPHRDELKNGRRFMACWVGLMGPQDHVDLALGAIDELVHHLDRTDCHFVFIGEGETYQRARELTRRLGLTDYVTFTGWLDHDGIFEYLSTADLGLESNLQQDVTPVKGMEYMAFGLPFVAFDLKESRAMAQGAAHYVQPGDVQGFARAIDRLLDDEDLRSEMGRAGRARIEQALAWDHQKKEYLALYARLLGS